MSEAVGDAAPAGGSESAPTAQSVEKSGATDAAVAGSNGGEGSAASGGGGKSGGGNRRHRGPPRDKTCYNCGQSGHFARDCQNPRLEGEERQVINTARAQFRRCFNCGKMGHISAECTKPAGNKACYNCGQDGHIARDCPNQRNE